jgi:hypothetical protein
MPFLIPIVTAIGSAIAAAGAWFASLSAIAQFGIQIAISIGLNLLASALQPKQKKPPGGLETELKLGGEVPRTVIFGEAATRGHLIYWNTYGANNTYLHMVFALSDSHCEALTGLIMDGEVRQLDALTPTNNADAKYVVNGFATANAATDPFFLEIKFFSGKQGQLADTELVATANPNGRWTNNDKLSGICYVSVRLRWQDIHFGERGIPEFLFIVKGSRLYDFRKDTTNGGSGAHRYGTPSTYEWSDNPAVILYNCLRGIQTGPTNERILGLRAKAADIDNTTFTAAANACDELVALKAGGTEKRYRGAFIASDDDATRELIEAMVGAMAGFTVERSGKIGVVAGASQSVVDTVTDADLVSGAKVAFSGKRSRTELANYVSGTFTDPENLWQANAFPPITSTTFETEDGERLGRDLSLPSVTSVTQAQRVSRIRMLELRSQGSATITLGFNKIWLQGGDWITWNSARYGNRTWRIVTREIDGGSRQVTLVLDEISSTVYTWNGTLDEGDPLRVGQTGLLGDRVNSVAGFGVQQASADRPVVRFSWTPIEDPTVIGVEIHVREVNTFDYAVLFAATPASGSMLWNAAEPGTKYEARARVVTDPPRPTSFSSWTSMAAAAQRFDERNFIRNGQFETGAIIPAAATDIPHWYLTQPTAFKVVARTDSSVPAGAPAPHVLRLTSAGGQDPVLNAEFAPALSGAATLGVPVRVGDEVFIDIAARNMIANAVSAFKVRLGVRTSAGSVVYQDAFGPAKLLPIDGPGGLLLVGPDNWDRWTAEAIGVRNAISFLITTDGQAFLELRKNTVSFAADAFFTDFVLTVRDGSLFLAENSVTYHFDTFVATGADDVVGTGVGATKVTVTTASITTVIPPNHKATIEASALTFMTFTGAGLYDQALELSGTSGGWSAGNDVSQPPPVNGAWTVYGTGLPTTYTVEHKWSGDSTVKIAQRRLDCRLLIR